MVLLPGFFLSVAITAHLLVAALAMTEDELTMNVRAWQDVGGMFKFPEMDVPELVSRPNNALSFSGGGSRAYTASLGYLSAFHKLDLIRDMRYIGGVSGGGYAASVYTYSQTNVTDEVLLGAIINPQDITLQGLSKMDDNCARGVVNCNFVAVVATSGKWDLLKESVFDALEYGIQRVYLDPFSIPDLKPFTYNARTMADIKRRNPFLTSVDFVLPRQASVGVDERPLAVSVATILGPDDMLPITPANRDYNLFEMSPLYAGIYHPRTSEFNHGSNDTYNEVVGGLLETFAVGDFANCPDVGLQPNEASAELELKFDAKQPQRPMMDIKFMTTASGWNLGQAIATHSGSLVLKASGTLAYWPPAANKPKDHTHNMLVADGGGLQVDNLISFVQRRVKTIVLFCQSNNPLFPPSQWNPASDVFSNQMDFDLPAFFGVLPANMSDTDMASYDITRSQIFPTEEWVPLAQKLQKALLGGNGIVVPEVHTTVRNDFYGIPAGLKVTVVWVYLDRVKAWEDQLSDEMKKEVLPETDPENSTSRREKGTFAGFPGYGAAREADMDFKQSNLLANLAGWTVLQNADVFKAVL